MQQSNIIIVEEIEQGFINKFNQGTLKWDNFRKNNRVLVML